MANADAFTAKARTTCDVGASLTLTRSLACTPSVPHQGVDTLVCVSVNDPFVMDAWAKSVDTKGKVLLLADGSGLFTKACGLELDLTEKGLGMRSRRYAMLLEDGVVKTLRLEEGGAFTVSSAEDILASM